MRLIDAEGSKLQAHLKLIREAEYQIYGSGSWGFTAKCEHAIEDAPTIQPEPQIIRCRDCKYSDPSIMDSAKRWLPCMSEDKDDDWFCGYAERKEE